MVLQVVESFNLHGGQLVAKVLLAHGVRFVFTLVGTVLLTATSILAESFITFS